MKVSGAGLEPARESLANIKARWIIGNYSSPSY
jgi:hypothetical protein